MSAVPGWYPDPAGSRELRLWDGEAWTSQLRPADAPEAFAAPPTAQPAPARVLAGVGAVTAEPASYFSSVIPAAAPLREQDWSRASWQPRPAKSRRTLITGAIVGVVVIIAAAAVPMVIARSGSIYDRTSVRMPKTAAGFKQMAEVNTTVSSDLVKSLPFSGMRMGVYGQADSPAPAAILMAGRGRTPAADVDSELNKAESSLSASAGDDQPMVLSSFQPMAPGPLGGRMSCATSQTDEVPAAVCVFVDQGAAGALLTYNTPTADPTLMHQLRGAVEKRG
jgi:hypothetical protein